MKKNLKKILVSLFFVSSLCTPLIGVSCNNESTLKISTPTPWSKDFKANEIKFFKEVENKYNELKNQDTETKKEDNIILNSNLLSDNRTLAENVITNKSQIAIVSSVFLNNQYNETEKYIDKVKPILLAKTFAPKYDTEMTFYNYDDNSKIDKIVALQNKDFTKKPYKEWTDEEYKYKFGIYQQFYEPIENSIIYQRGAIFIAGDDNTLNKIKKAWNDRDWKTFREFGIVKNQKISSSTRFVYPEFLFKKHFNKENNKFNGFIIDENEHKENYANYPIHTSATHLGQEIFKDFHIFLGEANEYAFHHNDPDKNYFSRMNNEKVEVLTLTDPFLFYSVIASNTLTDKQIELLQKAILEVSKENKDDFSYRIGINGYTKQNATREYIKDFYNKAKN